MTQDPSAQAVADYFEHFQWRVLQDALLEGTAAYWERRAATFDWVAGNPTTPDPHGIRARATATAQACRNHARFLRTYGLDDATQQAIARIIGHPLGQAS